MTRIAQMFDEVQAAGKRALIPFLVAGDPDLKTTHELIVEFAHRGASLIELGVPFSDPMADGPTIQRASERALRNGVTLNAILQMVSEARKQTDVPIILFSYYNPLLSFGLEDLVTESKRAGIDGILVTELLRIYREHNGD